MRSGGSRWTRSTPGLAGVATKSSSEETGSCLRNASAHTVGPYWKMDVAALVRLPGTQRKNGSWASADWFKSFDGLKEV